MQDAQWLREMLSQELEVRPPHGLKREQRLLSGNVATLRNDGSLIGYTNIKNYGKTAEITAFIIDPEFRGKGNAKKLIQKVIELTPHKMILSCTRNPKMAAALQGCGFEITYWPGLKAYIFLTINSIKRVFSILFRLQFKRLWVQVKGFTKYKIYKLQIK